MSVEQKTDEVVKSQDVLVPERELVTPDGYRWFVYNFTESGIRLICIEDIETGIVFTTSVVSDKTRVASHRAWAGARQSRSPGTPWEILDQMGRRGVDPDAQLDEVFRKYGHSSVGDMARIAADTAYGPMHICFVHFAESPINSGQEKSTRFQKKFEKAVLHDIKHYLPEGLDGPKTEELRSLYQHLGELSLVFFEKYRSLLTPAFQQYFGADMFNPAHKDALNARVLDCSRYFLLFGQSSGMSFETSARDWSRIIAELKTSPVRLYHRVAAQVERLFAPTTEEEAFLEYKAEAPSLIRHTEPMGIANRNMEVLRDFIKSDSDLLEKVSINVNFLGRVDQNVSLIPPEYTEAERMVAQYLLTIWPGLDKYELFAWVHSQPEVLKREISSIILDGHDNYHELPYMARTTRLSFDLGCFLGESRDFNRHRAFGRFITLPLVFGLPLDKSSVEQILAKGFGLPLYLTYIPEFAPLAEEFEKDMMSFYGMLYRFVCLLGKAGVEDYSAVINLLPLGQKIDFFMHGDPKQALYMPHQRTRSGGHINYRDLAFQANQLVSNSDPYLSGLRLGKRPNPGSREEFFDRS